MPDETQKPQEPTSLEVVTQFARALSEAIKQQPQDITHIYANSSFFEVSGWDLKIFFGQLDQRPIKNEVDWHTAITVPWTQARVLEYYLRANVVFYEKKFGPINMPAQLTPPAPIEPTKEQIESDPQAIELWKTYKNIHEEMFGGNKSAALEQPLTEEVKQAIKSVIGDK
jgi:hypothetical protein